MNRVFHFLVRFRYFFILFVFGLLITLSFLFAAYHVIEAEIEATFETRELFLKLANSWEPGRITANKVTIYNEEKASGYSDENEARPPSDDTEDYWYSGDWPDAQEGLDRFTVHFPILFTGTEVTLKRDLGTLIVNVKTPETVKKNRTAVETPIAITLSRNPHIKGKHSNSDTSSSEKETATHQIWGDFTVEFDLEESSVFQQNNEKAISSHEFLNPVSVDEIGLDWQQNYLENSRPDIGPKLRMSALYAGDLKFPSYLNKSETFRTGANVEFKNVRGEIFDFAVSGRGISINFNAIAGDVRLRKFYQTGASAGLSLMPTLKDWITNSDYFKIFMAVSAFLLTVLGVLEIASIQFPAGKKRNDHD